MKARGRGIELTEDRYALPNHSSNLGLWMPAKPGRLSQTILPVPKSHTQHYDFCPETI